jgi:SRSO17 transposase
LLKSPWAEQGVYEQIQAEISQKPELRSGSLLILDEYADEKAGILSADSLRQYNGRIRKVDECQVSVVLGYANRQIQPWPTWAIVDSDPYLAEEWFTPDFWELRHKLGVPAERKVFENKPELGLKMIRRTKLHQLPFEAVLCDALYGRRSQFRCQLNQEHLLYMADIPANLRIYLDQPIVGIPESKPGKKDPKPQNAQVLNGIRSYSVK